MSIKQLLAALSVLAALVLAFWFLRVQPPATPPLSDTPVLMGTSTPEGDYYYVENAPYYTIDAYYPSRTALEGSADIKARHTIEQRLADRIAEFKQNSNFDALTAEDIKIQGLGGDRKYALALEYKAYASPSYASYRYAIYEDTLGAHPNGYYLTFVFDKEGNEVQLSQVLGSNPNWLEELSLLVSNNVTAQLKARTGTDDLSGAVFAEGLSPKVQNFENFVVDGDTLAIFIPPYQVAAYAVGAFEVRIPLADLR
ncbi:hypothetical protein A3D70_02235 [Candidatus Adlerbacteria bacterium RIFCSPHIGHO2_02_FULL_54_18]|uniref:DUF3298 domain-containing protein n=2 Tax=Candidatus Adleribacteriota TaxID=1752736 RepID=A0A1F4Y3V9_9BACT|nr:MAG: hypothetical protein A2949_00425 [Candidatus Adlerbacteria bacterium RIFCSPLOWO2_01_FULL_54_21b]OGC88622.1 MAG: hypothetical protein A3D70_02235 [Candidatus Adlerbacteria bacterium RIFCSPHIGHO2_02_FULL_54_18]